MQERVVVSDLANGVCPTKEEIEDFNKLTNAGARRNFRDKVVLNCVQAINAKYAAFKANLQKEAVSTNLVTDILSLGLTSAAALTGGEAAQQLAGAGAFVIGTGTAINKDVFYQQTLPAIESSMDAKRDALLAAIINSEKSDPDATNYTLANAGIDLNAYETAGNIYTAISELTKTANVAAQAAKNELTAVQNKSYDVDILSDDVQTREEKLTNFIRGLEAMNDNTKLNEIANRLVIPIPPNATVLQKRVAIVGEIDRRVSTAGIDHKKALDEIVMALNGVYTENAAP